MTTLNGITLGPHSPRASRAGTGRGCRGEGDEAALCDDFVLRAPRGSLANLSQQRASNLTRGLSDRRYRFYGASFFYEIKAEDGQLTATQHGFLLDELANGALATCGTLDDLQWFAARCAAGHTRLDVHCLTLVMRWAAKGYRREDTRPQRRRRS